QDPATVQRPRTAPCSRIVVGLAAIIRERHYSERQVSQYLLRYGFVDFPEQWLDAAVENDAQLYPRLLTFLDHSVCIFQRKGDRLFDENVFSSPSCFNSLLRVLAARSTQDDRIDVGSIERGIQTHAWNTKFCRDTLETFWIV